jgi:hypothetical protein
MLFLKTDRILQEITPLPSDPSRSSSRQKLRLELSPFNVGVLSIVMGAVRTQGQTYFGDFKLPADSLYSSIEDTIASLAQGNDGATRMDLLAYSAQVVNQITKGATEKFWHGDYASVVKLGSSHLPQSLMVSSQYPAPMTIYRLQLMASSCVQDNVKGIVLDNM